MVAGGGMARAGTRSQGVGLISSPQTQHERAASIVCVCCVNSRACQPGVPQTCHRVAPLPGELALMRHAGWTAVSTEMVAC